MIISKTIDLLQGIKDNYSDLKCKKDALLCDLKNKIEENKLFLEFTDHTNELFLHAIRTYTNINILTIFGKNKNSAYRDFYTSKYKDKYILYGIKSIVLKKSTLIKLFYQILYYRHQKRYIQDFMLYIENYLEDYEDFIEKENDDMIVISTLIMLKRSLSTDFYSMEDEIEKDYYLFIPASREEQWIMATLLFNQNSLDFLEKQDLKYYLKRENKKYWDKMNDFLKFVYQVVPIEDRHRLLFYSSTILYFIGHRSNNDFDFMIFNKDDNPNFHAPLRAFQLEQNVSFEMKGEKGIYDFSYINTQDRELKRAYYEEFYDKWAQTYGVLNFETIYASGKDHMYYLGMKSTLLEQDIIRRQLRNRPRAIADLISLRKRYGLKFDIPQIPKSADKFYKVDKLSLEEKSNLLQKGGKIITKYGFEELKVVENIDQTKFLETIIWALKERYNMIFTISEILIELGMEKNSEIKNTFHLNKSSTYEIRIGKEKEEAHVATPTKKIIVIKTKNASTGEITKSIKVKDEEGKEGEKVQTGKKLRLVKK